MESFLSHFDANEYVDYVKKESYDSGYDSGYGSGYDSGALAITIGFYLDGYITLKQAIKKLNLSEVEFQAAVEEYKQQQQPK